MESCLGEGLGLAVHAEEFIKIGLVHGLCAELSIDLSFLLGLQLILPAFLSLVTKCSSSSLSRLCQLSSLELLGSVTIAFVNLCLVFCALSCLHFLYML